MDRIKVLQLIPTLDQSGAEKQLALLAAGLPRDRFDVLVLALTRGGYYERFLRDKGVRVEVLGKRTKWDPTALHRLYQRVKQEKPDILQTWLFAANCYGRVAGRWARVPHLIASERCVDTWKRQYQFAIDRFLSRWTDVVVVNSDAVRTFYQSVGIPAEKLHVIPNAVPPPVNAPSTVDPAEIRRKLGIPSDEPILGVIGRLWPQKRVQDAIWATDVLRISGWRIHLVVVGDGPRRASLERFVHGLELEENVHFLGHRSDVRDLMRAMDVVLIPSKFEGMPNVALEAMQAGIPVVATRIPGMDEVVVDGATGILVPLKEPVAMAKAVGQLLTDAQRRTWMGESGRQRVAELFTVERLVDEHAELYQRLVAGKGI